MVWDRAEPTNTTKIRNLGTVIRPNWGAIEEGSSSFQPDALILTDRTPLLVGSDPSPAEEGGTSRGDGFTLYSKQDEEGDLGLFGIDPSGIITQFTSKEKTLGQTGYALIPPGFILQWGRDTLAGSTQSKLVTFPKEFSSTAWVVTTNPYQNPVSGANNPREWGAEQITEKDFRARLFNGITHTSGVNFGWIAIGPL
jgi:hypothetical protein